MNSISFYKSLRTLVLVFTAFVLTASSSHALDLAAVEAEWTPPGSATPIRMWGFVEDTGSCPPGPVPWGSGPELIGVAGGPLSVVLRNCLSEPVSIVIPGQPAALNPQFFTDGQGRARVRAFTHEASAAGGLATYTWSDLKAGTFLYQSGSHPAKQVQMGLYGALKVGGYPDVVNEVTLLFSEIDPALHGTPTAANSLSYKPKYFLINGQSHSAGQPALDVGQADTKKLLRFINAGLMSHTPVVQGEYMNVVAEDGNPYNYAREQYSVLLPAGKTLDALWTPTGAGTHAVFDRSLSMSSNGAVGGGMLVHLDVATFVGLPLADAGPDQSGVTLTAPPVALDGSGSTGAVTYDWSFVQMPPGSGATLSDPSIVNPTFAADVEGTYVVQLVVADVVPNNSVPDTVVITTNYAPVADAGPDQVALAAALVSLDGSGSSDPDLDTLTYSWSFNVVPAGSLAALSDPLIVNPTFTADIEGTYEVQLIVNDGNQDSAPDVVVITGPVILVPPTAVDDPDTVPRSSLATFIDVLSNDTAGDGTIDPGTIVITTGAGTTEGGRVAAKNGGVMYRPLNNYLGLDTFRYTVRDDLGSVSNEATVTVDVVDP